ncbi:MAG: UDP-galactopyranose mutase [Alistipes sp.]|nr:UDP-galactopyranose mutase [Alistipes sp.]
MASNKRYDYLVVGAGLFGAVVAYRAHKAGRRVLVVDRRNHTGGNTYCEERDGIFVHRYGAHIFHTSNREVWEFVTSLAEFHPYTHTPQANYRGEIYPLPFNLNTYEALWGTTSEEEARAKIEEQRLHLDHEPANLKEQALSLVGRDIYEKLIEGYTEKQWGRSCEELPAWIIRRLPLRYERNNNYFNDTYQAIPTGGYNPLIERLLEGCDVRLNCDYIANREELDSLAERVVYTGELDRFYDYRFGRLEYRSLRFEEEQLDKEYYQEVSVVNYTDNETPFTRIIEHKHFEDRGTPHTVITREYPLEWSEGKEAYYPINDERNTALYAQYRALADKEPRHIFGGRLADYRYYDMHEVIEKALAVRID